METFAIARTTRKPYPKLPYHDIKDAILGKQYILSLTFVGTRTAKKLNEAHRNKTYTPNVLSFPLDVQCGEVFICPQVAHTQAQKFKMTKNGYIGYLFIHACLHLKGHRHGDTMDKAERSYCRKFALQ